MVVSHARDFLNMVCTAILHLHSRKLTSYKGDFDTFERTATERLRNAKKAAEGQERQRAHMQVGSGVRAWCFRIRVQGFLPEYSLPPDSTAFLCLSAFFFLFVSTSCSCLLWLLVLLLLPDNFLFCLFRVDLCIRMLLVRVQWQDLRHNLYSPHLLCSLIALHPPKRDQPET